MGEKVGVQGGISSTGKWGGRGASAAQGAGATAASSQRRRVFTHREIDAKARVSAYTAAPGHMG